MGNPLTGHYAFTPEMIADLKPLWDSGFLRECYENAKTIGRAITVGDNMHQIQIAPDSGMTLEKIAQLDAAMMSMRWDDSRDEPEEPAGTT